MKEITHNLRHYIPLFGVLAAGFIGFLLFQYDRNFQIAILVSTAASYVSWGIVHHHIHQDLHISVVIEYLTIAFLGVIIAVTLLFRV